MECSFVTLCFNPILLVFFRLCEMLNPKQKASKPVYNISMENE